MNKIGNTANIYVNDFIVNKIHAETEYKIQK